MKPYYYDDGGTQVRLTLRNASERWFRISLPDIFREDGSLLFSKKNERRNALLLSEGALETELFLKFLLNSERSYNKKNKSYMPNSIVSRNIISDLSSAYSSFEEFVGWLDKKLVKRIKNVLET